MRKAAAKTHAGRHTLTDAHSEAHVRRQMLKDTLADTQTESHKQAGQHMIAHTG